jgi:CTP:molybdopterin cytidylyltransferase MocA
MGEPKQLLRLGGRTLVEQVLENVRAPRIADVVLVLGCAAETIVQQVSVEGIKVVVNEAYQSGMGSSLRVGLSALDPLTGAALIALADQPFVRPQTYDRIIEQYRQSEAQIVVPTYYGFRGNPVLLDRSVFPEVMALTGDIGCRAIFGDHSDGIVKVAVDDIGILLDIDNQDDLAMAQRFYQSEHDPGAMLEAMDLRGRTVPQAVESSRVRDDLIIVGTEPVAIALARLGHLLQFRVTVVDPLLRASDLPEADQVLNGLDFSQLPPTQARFVVIASRGRFDEEAIEQAFTAGCNYLALVANRKRAHDVRRRLEDDGQPPEKLATLRAPAGLDIGANTPEEIALSILAEIVSLKRTSSGSSSAGES